MAKIILKLFLVTSPVLFVLAIYFYNDPFKVLYHYNSYYPKDGIQPVTLNKDFVSTETFINGYPEYQYDSYIFGNSRSMFYAIADWSKHINSDKCFHYDASDEGLYGIEKKFRFLNNRGVKIKNALIILDHSVYQYYATKNDVESHLFVKHPLLSGQSRYRFQVGFLKAFCSKDFLLNYITVLFTHNITPTMVDNGIFNKTEAHYEVSTNEISFRNYESLIARNKDSFYLPRMRLFYKRNSIQQYASKTLTDDQKMLFASIKKILDENRTIYRIIINPLYDQEKIDSSDLKVLKNIFGATNVYDFSGINDITNNIYNYYENSHYRPFIAAMIMDSIYSNSIVNNN